MRNGLIFKLMGAFLLVIAIGALVISILTSQATRSAFTLYTTRGGQVWAQRLAPLLAAYYARNNGWQGVDGFLQSDVGVQITPGEMGKGPGGGRENGLGRQNSGEGMMGLLGQRLILTDAQGVVINDTQEELVGAQIPPSELKKATEIIVNNRLVGAIIVTANDSASSGTPAGEFLASVNKAIISSAVIAGVIALILGGVLFVQITSPLRKLKKAAAAIASGDLSQRVSIHSRDEFGELGNTFNHMAESLAKAELQRRHLVADVAHELRTPLAAMQGTLEGLQDGVLPLDQEQVAALYSETMLLNRLVGDLKLLSLAETGQIKLEKQETDLEILLQQIVERARPQVDLKHVHLQAELQPGMPRMWVDSDRITQVVNNLVGNALRYTPEGGSITVQGSVIPPGDALQVSVTDTGPGIDPADLPFVFDRFYRSDKSRTRATGGSGLGLAIVRQLVEAHGGSVKAESPVFQDQNRQGYGTRLTFTLPTH